MSELPDNIVDLVNAQCTGYDASIGLRYTHVSLSELKAEVDLGEQHHQPYGLVHGGVYAGIVESMCSVGAAVSVIATDCNTVGLENNTSFLRAVRRGKLHCTARPEYQGRRSQVWVTEIRDDDNRLAAVGRVRTLVLEPGAQAAGEAVKLPQK